jgi:hypothetical protein
MESGKVAIEALNEYYEDVKEEVTPPTAVELRTKLDMLENELQPGMYGAITLTLSQDDLINMIKGCGPPPKMSSASDLVVTAYVDRRGIRQTAWSPRKLRQLSVHKLYDLYKEVK